MARRLTLRALAKLDKRIGRHADGDGLYLKAVSYTHLTLPTKA